MLFYGKGFLHVISLLSVEPRLHHRVSAASTPSTDLAMSVSATKELILSRLSWWIGSINHLFRNSAPCNSPHNGEMRPDCDEVLVLVRCFGNSIRQVICATDCHPGSARPFGVRHRRALFFPPPGESPSRTMRTMSGSHAESTGRMYRRVFANCQPASCASDKCAS
jgi:hypothetical protein